MTYALLFPSPPDVTRAASRLDALLSASPKTWSTSQAWGVSLIKDWLENRLTNQVEESHLHMLLARLFELPASNAKDNFGAFVGPILKWAFTQPWSTGLDMRRPFSALCNQHYEALSRTQPHHGCAASLNHILALAPFIPQQYQTELVRHAFSNVNTRMDWEYRKGDQSPAKRNDWYIFAQLSLLLSTVGIVHTPLKASWRSAMTQYMRSMTPESQTQWLMDILNSNMIIDDKHRTMALAYPNTWLNPDVVVAIEPLLPTNDLARFDVLTWARVDNAPQKDVSRETLQALNQQLLATYCPPAQELVLGLASQDDWLNKDRIAELMHALQLSKTVGHYDLPDLETVPE